MTSAALIVAAGRGHRAGGELPKQYSLLGGKPVLLWSIEAFAAAGLSDIIVAIDPAHEVCAAQQSAGARYAWSKAGQAALSRSARGWAPLLRRRS
ncbi:MAG: 2-C-methyl-D-erythritol 4-phosphate cytidylyltransferase [Terricaulis sp.]|nr:2-C-methyl-D-erythritol 4-phosphate cytidylyltransferase [Terricaulis sp.]